MSVLLLRASLSLFQSVCIVFSLLFCCRFFSSVRSSLCWISFSQPHIKFILHVSERHKVIAFIRLICAYEWWVCVDATQAGMNAKEQSESYMCLCVKFFCLSVVANIIAYYSVCLTAHMTAESMSIEAFFYRSRKLSGELLELDSDLHEAGIRIWFDVNEECSEYFDLKMRK